MGRPPVAPTVVDFSSASSSRSIGLVVDAVAARRRSSGVVTGNGFVLAPALDALDALAQVPSSPRVGTPQRALADEDLTGSSRGPW